MNKGQMNLQDAFLNRARKQGVGVTVYLITGVQLKGTVRAFDSFTILLDGAGRGQQLIYKHSVTSIVPMAPISLSLTESEASEEVEEAREGQAAS